jgi:hypothetical protein
MICRRGSEIDAVYGGRLDRGVFLGLLLEGAITISRSVRLLLLRMGLARTTAEQGSQEHHGDRAHSGLAYHDDRSSASRAQGRQHRVIGASAVAEPSIVPLDAGQVPEVDVPKAMYCTAAATYWHSPGLAEA